MARVPERAVAARDDLHAPGHRGAEPRRLRLRPRPRRPGRRHRHDRARAPLEPRAVAGPRPARPARRCATCASPTTASSIPSRSSELSDARAASSSSPSPQVVELARHAERRPGARALGARARRGDRGRRRPGGAAPAGRRAGARLRLLRHLRPQDVRPRRRRAVGPRGAARADGAVPDRRRDDQHGLARAHAPGTSCRGSSRPARPRSPSASASAPRSTTCSGRDGGDRRPRAGARPRYGHDAAAVDPRRHPVRAAARAARRRPHVQRRGHPPARRRPDARRRRRSACAPATTAPSR